MKTHNDNEPRWFWWVNLMLDVLILAGLLGVVLIMTIGWEKT